MIKLKSTVKAIGILAAVFCMNAAAVNNPISYNQGITDCDVLKYNGEYYITGNLLRGDILRSRDLESWGEKTHAFSWNNTWFTPTNPSDPDADIGAPHLRYFNGVFHQYAQLNISSGIAHATSSSIWGPYTEPVNAPFSGSGWLIDPDTFLDEDGQLYYYETNRQGTSGHDIRARTMSNPSTLSGTWDTQIQDSQSWEGTVINEGSEVFKYRNRYYMLYCGNASESTNYAIGCVEASTPLGFNNSGKYSNNPILSRATPPGSLDEITHFGQPWVVDGPNGFEKWMGHFGQTVSDGRTQRIEHMHFFNRTLFIDGPSDRNTTGYHPGPAKPQLLNIFSIADGALPSNDWNPQAGIWTVANEEALQSDQNVLAFNTVNRDAAENYLIEANLKFTAAQDGEDKAGVIAYYLDANNFVLVGFDRVADDWYLHVKENGADTYQWGNYGGSVNYGVYHKIRVTKNAGTFDLRIDDMIPPGFSTVNTIFTGAGLPGLFTYNTAAAFDGILYTIGWDEYDSGVTGWGNTASGIPAIGSWSTDSTGITMADGTGYSFKGDLMPEYEFATQVYKAGGADGSMGIFAVAIDGNNYVTAVIDLATDELVIGGIKSGVVLTEQRVSVANKTDYNLRVAKLADRMIFFVDGEEKLTLNETYGAAQIGLYAVGMSARFNGIMAYRTEPDILPTPWVKTDIGAVGFPGTIDFHDNAFYMTGSGSDIWATSDEFSYTHIDANGDWEMSARVVNIDESDYWSKASLMFRNDLSTNSAMAMVCATGGAYGLGHAQLMWRNNAGDFTSEHDVADLSFPIWLKLKRQGATFSGYYSTDGQNWILLGSETPPLNPEGMLGIGVTAKNNDRIATAVFDNMIIAAVPADVSVEHFTAFAAPFHLHASEFYSPYGYSFASTRWQISSSSDFSSPKWDSGVAPAQNYVVVPASSAAASDYGRVRYQDDQGQWGEWSDASLLNFSNHTIAHWRFENGAAGTQHTGDQDNWYQDMSGNENHLSSWEAASRPTASADRAFATVPQIGAQNKLSIDFSPNSDLGTFSAQTGAKMIETHIFSNGWTIEATFKLRALYWEVILGKDGKRAAGVEAPVWLKVMDSNKHIEFLFLDNNDDYHFVQSLEPIEANKWYSIAVTYDNIAARLYLKGEGDADYVYQGAVSAPAGATLGQYANTWTVGRGMHDGNPVDFINGMVDEIRISDIPLNSSSFIGAEVEANYDFDIDGMADDWELEHFNSVSNCAPDIDSDGDALVNLVEYALGGDPSDAGNTGYPLSFDLASGSTFEYVYPRRKVAGPSYRLQTRTNLTVGSWSEGGYTELPNPGTLDADFEAVTNSVPDEGLPQKFIRLIIE